MDERKKNNSGRKDLYTKQDATRNAKPDFSAQLYVEDLHNFWFSDLILSSAIESLYRIFVYIYNFYFIVDVTFSKCSLLNVHNLKSVFSTLLGLLKSTAELLMIKQRQKYMLCGSPFSISLAIPLTMPEVTNCDRSFLPVWNISRHV